MENKKPQLKLMNRYLLNTKKIDYPKISKQIDMSKIWNKISFHSCDKHCNF